MKKYDMAMDISPDSIPGMIIDRLEPGMTVLEFGCSYGRMTKYISQELHCAVSIVELDQEAYPIARSYAQDGFCGDIDQEGWYLHFSGQQFDRILFADVLEHLRDPLKALKRAKSLLTEDGEILISLPNIGHNDILVKLFQNRFEYTSIGLLDNTHIHFWGEKNLESFAEDAGFGIRLLDGVYQEPFYTEQKPDKNDVPDELLNLLTTREYNEVYQFFLVLQKREWMEQQGLSCVDQLKNLFSSWVVCAYWDIGTGYQSGQYTRLIPELMPNGKFRFYCDSIPEGCRKVRFDPPLGYQCLVSDIHVSTNIGCRDIYPLNGASVNGVVVFSNTNPQMEFSLPRGAQWFDISALIRICSGVEFGEVFSALQKLPQEEATIDSLQAQLAQKAAENEDLLDQLEELCAQREVLQEHNKWRDRKIQELEGGQSPRSHDTNLEAHIANLEAHANYLQASYNDLAFQYHTVVTSQCWKLTKPLRLILSGLKKTRLGALPYHILTAYRKSRNERALTETANTGTAENTASDFPNGSDIPVKTLSQMANQITASGGQVFHQELFLSMGISSKKKILLFSHELNLTGAPVALSYLAKCVQKQGYFPVIIAPHNGALGKHLVEEEFPVLIYEPILSSNLIQQYANVFDAIVVCTIVGAPIVSMLNGATVPVLWWIHEAQASYHEGTLAVMPEALRDNIHIYSVCSYADHFLKQHRPSYQTNQLLYYVPDFTKELPKTPSFRLKYADGKTVFTIVGVQEERKGQDILIQAIRDMDPAIRKQCLFVFVGKPFYVPIQKLLMTLCEDFPRNVQYIEQLTRTDMLSLYMQIDCLICASRDDPMPIVVTEAMLMSKAVICSENTGSAEILEKMDSGLVYHDNDPGQLTQCIEYVATHQEELAPMCQRARKTYEQFFTQEVFEQSVKCITDRLIAPAEPLSPYHGKVSVVIPTYNAGKNFAVLLSCLQSQEKIDDIEIIVVDSESADGTDRLAEQMGAKVIPILHAEFSHSYARNLGAKHATGEYLLFMTQDATPTDSNWLCGLMQPVLKHRVIAVSCRETPRPDCDLLGRLAIWIHSDYMGILETDRIMHMPAIQDFNSLRRNGQLNDVTCLVRRDVFLQFKYHGDYAEDLDLGLRLIRAGYSLALLSSVQVIHSHTRPALYHMKRALVDQKTLKSILPDIPIENITSQLLCNRVVTAFCALALYLEQLSNYPENESWDSFFTWSSNCFSKNNIKLSQTHKKGLLEILQAQGSNVDDDLKSFTEKVFRQYWDHFELDSGSASAWQHFLTHTVSQYFAAHRICYSVKIRQEIMELLPKYLAQLFGILLAFYAINYPSERGLLQEMIEQYSSGV